jgi:hypothetical protein
MKLTAAVAEQDSFSGGGPDNIIAKMIQMAIQEDEIIIKKLLELYNDIKTTQYIPYKWKGSTTSLIYKEGSDPHSVNGYRPISLLSVFYKIYTYMLNHRCSMMIEKYSLISNSQNEFRPAKETTYCINALMAQMRIAKETQKPLHAIYIDFAKAFDSVPYWAILETLKTMNFGVEFINNIEGLYFNIYTQFKTAHGYTDKVFLHSGVRQGDVISPTLYILSLAPLIWKLNSLQLEPLPSKVKEPIFTFADDTVLLASNQKDIEHIYNLTSEYANEFGIHINAKKSGYAWINDKPYAQPTYNLQNIEMLREQSTYKYLGIHINMELDFNKHINIITAKYKSVVKTIMMLKGWT